MAITIIQIIIVAMLMERVVVVLTHTVEIQMMMTWVTVQIIIMETRITETMRMEGQIPTRIMEIVVL